MTMVKLFEINGNHCYTDNPHVEKNVFITKEPDTEPLPVYEEIKDQLPRPIWDGHDSAIECRPAFPVSGDADLYSASIFPTVASLSFSLTETSRTEFFSVSHTTLVTPWARVTRST